MLELEVLEQEALELETLERLDPTQYFEGKKVIEILVASILPHWPGKVGKLPAVQK